GRSLGDPRLDVRADRPGPAGPLRVEVAGLDSHVRAGDVIELQLEPIKNPVTSVLRGRSASATGRSRSRTTRRDARARGRNDERRLHGVAFVDQRLRVEPARGGQL